MRPSLVAYPLLVLLAACGSPPESPGVPAAEAPTGADRQAAEGERTGFPVEVENALGMHFRLVPGASFRMGEAVSGEAALVGDAPHQVRFVTPYYLQVGLVTNGQYRRFRPEHGGGSAAEAAPWHDDLAPARGVSYDDAVAYAAWLREQDPTWRYRLPTEAEWEYAARGGVSSVDRSADNAWGIGALGAPLAEWCHDRYGPYPTWPQDNPQGATCGALRVARGGALPETADRPVCGRAPRAPDSTSAEIGFRLAFGLGYARHDHGAHAIAFRTVDPTAEGSEAFLRPGYELYMISIPDRLTDRQNDPNARPFWTAVPRRTPTVVKLWPGRYYVYCHRTRDAVWARGLEVKFEIPGLEVIDVPVPREDQVSPQ